MCISRTCVLLVYVAFATTVHSHEQCYDELVPSGNNVYTNAGTPLIDGKRVVSLGQMDNAAACQSSCAGKSPPCHSWTYYFANYSFIDNANQMERDDAAGYKTPESQLAKQCLVHFDDHWDPQFAFGNRMVSGINCASPPATAVPNPPPPNVQFSWEHVPVFFHTSNTTGPYNQEALKIMAKFPLVTIEKFQGPDSGYLYPAEQWVCCEEDRIVQALKAVKSINPNVTGIFYYNMVLDFPQYRLHQEFSKNESWWLHDDNGNVVRVSGDHFPAKDLLVYDTTHQEVASLYIHACLDLVPGGAVDGCFIDRVLDGVPGKNISIAKQYDIQVSHLTTLQKFQQLLKRGPLLANHAYSMPGVNAVQIESFLPNEEGIAVLQWCARRGKLAEAHMGLNKGYTPCETDEGIQDYLAAFLIGAGDYAYFGCGRWFSNVTDISSQWKASYDRPLGTPEGLGIKTGTVYSRKFSSGTEVQFDVSTNKGTIKWA